LPAFDTEKYALLTAQYYYQLYKNDFEPIYYDDINNITYLYNYFFSIVPKFIVIISIIFIYNTINKEKNRGSLKLVFTQSVSRWEYYISKWISGLIYIIFILLFPTIIISLLLGMKNGFISMKYPTLYIKDTMTSLKPIPNYFDIIKAKMGSYPWFNKTALGYYAPSHKTFVDVVAEHNKTELIPFYKYLLMVLLLTILFIGFAVALVQLISAIINHEIISFLVATGVFIIGTLISSPFKYEKHLNLSPFTMENASRIIIGTYNVTALTSILILLGFTILLLIIGVIYFKKKEI
jgi:ABC-type transport system involved in multi-copper enzyme maturation permease subunit